VSSTSLERFFESYYRLRPVNATFTGVHDHDERLPDWSPEGLERAADEMRQLRDALPKASETEARTLQDAGRRDRALARSFLDVQLAEFDSRHFAQRNPSLAVGEVAFGLISLMTRPFAPATERAESAVGRLHDVARFLTGARQSLARPIPAPWRDRAVRECDGVARLLDEGLPHWPDVESIAAPVMERVFSASRHARAAVETFRTWLMNGAPIASSEERLGCGAALFDTLLVRGHWTARSRKELLDAASRELEEAIAQLHEHARRVAPGGWPEVQERLAADHPGIDDYVASYQRTWDRCRERSESRSLVTWPDYPIRYVPIPPHTRAAAPLLYYLFYRPPAPFDRLPVHDYVVTPIDDTMTRDEQERRLRAANMSVIKLNHVVHHGAIGHHVQNYRAYHGESEIGRVAAVDCASRIGMFLGGSMAEGWACYATELMDEAGFLTPEEEVAERHTRARLLARAVADITLHAGDANLSEVTSLYRDRVGMPEAAAQAEAGKNSMFPGAAVMYWLGTDTLRRLRLDRERAEGAAFSLQRFHDTVLSYGSIPVPLVAELMR